MVELTLRSVSVDLGPRRVLCDISLSVRPGDFVALLGANGAGKTTLLRAALGLLKRAGGDVMLGGGDPARLDPRARARLAAYLPQSRPLAWPLKVRDVVALGRFAHGAQMARLAPLDEAAIAEALAACDLQAMAERGAQTLSGGELARVHVARALAAKAPVIIADEPTAALDPLHAWRVLNVLSRFSADGGAVLASVHDPALAAQHASRLIVLSEGRIIADGPPSEVLTADLMARAYGVAAAVGRLADAPALAVLGEAVR